MRVDVPETHLRVDIPELDHSVPACRRSLAQAQDGDRCDDVKVPLEGCVEVLLLTDEDFKRQGVQFYWLRWGFGVEVSGLRGLVVLIRQHKLLVEIGLDLRFVEVDVLLLRLRLSGEECQGIVVDLLEGHWLFLLDQDVGGSEGVFERDLHVLFIVWVDEDVLAHGLAAAVFRLLRQFWNDGFKELVLQFEEEVEFPGVVYLAVDE